MSKIKKLMLGLAFMLVGITIANSQDIKVSGMVTDSQTKEPIPYASVILKGTQRGVMTENNGNFSINVPTNGTLVFSCIGYSNQEVAVNGRAVINIALGTDVVNMEQVVVTAAGIQRVEKSLGYAVSKIDADEGIQKSEPDLMRALDGKIAGVQIGSPSGSAGSATRVTIRGNSSFLGNNQPLYVVDGIPYSNDEKATTRQDSYGGGAYASGLSTLDPNDIESMSVLKGAAASALYGSRAANGVVLITTKSGSRKGRSQKGTEVSFLMSYTVENIAKLPSYQNMYGQGSNFTVGNSNGSWGAPFSEVNVRDMYSDISAVYPNWAIEHYPDLNGKVPYKAYKDNVKNLFNTGGIYEASVNVSNTNDKGNFGLTASHLQQEGYIPGDVFRRSSIGIGGNQKLDNKLRVGGNMSYSRTKQDGSMYGNNQSSSEVGGLNALARAFIMPRSWDMQNFPNTQPDGSNLLFNLTSQANNPYWSWKNDRVQSFTDRIVANANIGYDFAEWLSADYNFGVNDYKLERKEIINVGSRGFGGRGRILNYNQQIQELEGTFRLSFKNIKLAKDFGFNATIGQNFNQTTNSYRQSIGQDIINKGIFAIDNTKTQTSSESYWRKRIWAVFADAVFDYKQLVFLNLTGRYDFSSTLPKNNQSFFYPAVAASFIFSEAFNLKGNVLDYGKIRASWARVGNDASAYYVNGFYSTDSPYMGSGIMEYPYYSFDENLKPEFTTEWEVGLEMSFFKNRLGFDLALYTRNSTDQIAPVTLPGSSGYTSFYTNFGKMNNKGIELGFNVTPVRFKDFKWRIDGTYTLNRSEVKALAAGVDEIVVGGNFTAPRPVLMVGQPYGVLKGSVIAKDEDGDWLVDPASGQYIISAETGIIGNPNPKYKIGLNNTFSFKGVTLGVMLDFQKGGCVYSSYVTDLLGRGVTRDTENRLGTRILPGVFGHLDNATGKYVAYTDAAGNKIQNNVQMTESDLYFSSGSTSTFAINGSDDIAVYDATIIRLREISLGFDFPKKWLAKTFIGSLNLSIVGRNLWFYAPNVPKYTNYDPTANTLGGSNAQGIDYTSAPSTKRIGFNIKMTF